MSKEAMKLALEALDGLEALLLSMGLTHLIVYGDAEKAITALREALAEQPTDWEAVAADQAMTIALLRAEQPAQQRHISYACPQCHWSLEEQPAQQQEPVAIIASLMPAERHALLEEGYSIHEPLYTSPQPAQQQEPVAWNVIDPFGKIVATEKDAIRGWARIQGYKPTVESLLGFQEQGWRVVPTSPPAQRKPLTDEECDRIYTALDQWAREFDQYEFGLPTHCGDGMIGGRAIIRAAHGIKENT